MAELNAALMAAFNAINRDFYGNELEKPIITVKEGKTKKAFGWIETRKNWKQNGKDRHEINISVDFLGERTVTQTITTLMHGTPLQHSERNKGLFARRSLPQQEIQADSRGTRAYMPNERNNRVEQNRTNGSNQKVD